MKLHSFFAAVMGLLATTSGAAACGADSDCTLGDRHYRIAMPDGHDGATPVGAIVFAHGYRGSADGVMRNGSLRRMVSDKGLALIAVKSKADDWVIPNAPRHMDSDGSEEFDYFDAVLDDAAQKFAIDPARIMATGFSAGGMMVWNLACARSDRFAAFAPISGTFWMRPPDTCTGPIADVIHIHGDADKTVPLTGRKILETKQGEVFAALTMYRDYGGFSAPAAANHNNLRCEESSNPAGNLLNFCLFSGGHSFRTEYVSFAWDTFSQAGRL
ncbi:MAG: prolyl oligopeptidase family serine peptidase [Sulfitobacter sp.]